MHTDYEYMQEYTCTFDSAHITRTNLKHYTLTYSEAGPLLDRSSLSRWKAADVPLKAAAGSYACIVYYEWRRVLNVSMGY